MNGRKHSIHSNPVYDIRRTLETPALEGWLEAACWQQAEWIDRFVAMDTWAPAKPAAVALLWDAATLYVGLKLAEPQLGLIRAETAFRGGGKLRPWPTGDVGGPVARTLAIAWLRGRRLPRHVQGRKRLLVRRPRRRLRPPSHGGRATVLGAGAAPAPRGPPQRLAACSQRPTPLTETLRFSRRRRLLLSDPAFMVSADGSTGQRYISCPPPRMATLVPQRIMDNQDDTAAAAP